MAGSLLFERNRDRAIAVIPSGVLMDAEEHELERSGVERRCALAIDVALYVGDLEPAALGPALNAAYAQALATVLAHPTLDGRVESLRETEVAIELNHADRTAPRMGMGLALVATYTTGVAATGAREAILAAVLVALQANQPQPVCRRERVFAAVAAALDAQLPEPVERNGDRDATLPVTAPRKVLVLDGGHEVDEAGDTYTTRYHAEVEIACVGAAHGAETAADVVTALHDLADRVRAALWTDATLASLEVHLAELPLEPEVDRITYTAPCASLAMRWRLTFETADDNPASLPYAA